MAAKRIAIDWEALEASVERNAPDIESFLDTTSGQVITIVRGDPEAESLRAKVAASIENYTRIEPASSREQYRWMERFVGSVVDDGLRERLAISIDGKGAFRRFKDELLGYPAERERWFSYRADLLHWRIRGWLEENELEERARRPGVSQSPRRSSQRPPAGRRPRETRRPVRPSAARRASSSSRSRRSSCRARSPFSNFSASAGAERSSLRATRAATPHSVTRAATPHSVTRAATPRSVTRAATPRSVTRAATPRSVTRAATPRSVTRAATPRSVTRAATPRSVTRAATPRSATATSAPAESVVRESALPERPFRDAEGAGSPPIAPGPKSAIAPGALEGTIGGCESSYAALEFDVRAPSGHNLATRRRDDVRRQSRGRQEL